MTLTNFMRYGTMPKLSIVPNPNQGIAYITSSESLGEVEVEIIDMLGRICSKKNISLIKGIPTHLEIEEIKSGSYYLRLRSQGGHYLIHFAILH